MRKQVISNDDAKVNVVILSNESLGIVAKGVARCHAEDNYDKELGINLANTRAWLQYYDKLGKESSQELDYAYAMIEYWQNESVRLAQVKHLSETKAAAIKEELNNIMKDI